LKETPTRRAVEGAITELSSAEGVWIAHKEWHTAYDSLMEEEHSGGNSSSSASDDDDDDDDAHSPPSKKLRCDSHSCELGGRDF